MAARMNVGRRSRRGREGIFFALGMGMVVAMVAIPLLFRSQREAVVVQPVVAQFDMVELPVPADFVPAGSRLREVNFRRVSFPRHQVPVGAITNLEQILDRATLVALPANLPMFPENFGEGGSGVNPVIQSIPVGMRAMTLKVDATSAVEGWAGTGTTVDVLLIERDRTTVVAERVKILSAERSTSPVEGERTPNVPSTVTVLVSQEQCLAINTAIPRGRIAFALRSTTDGAQWNTTVFTADLLKGNSTPERRASVNGYVEVKDGASRRAFALTDGHWIASEKVPQGFLSVQPAEERRWEN